MSESLSGEKKNPQRSIPCDNNEKRTLFWNFFISNAEAISDIGDLSAYFYISQVSNRLGSIKLLN